MGRHIADKRTPSTGGRVKHFLRLSRTPRGSWHRPHTPSGLTRLKQFLRIERGREV
jgi:hypothetical protein